MTVKHSVELLASPNNRQIGPVDRPIGALLTKYSYRLASGKSGVPIVELGASSYEHNKYGIIFKPVFKLVSWEDEADLQNGIVAKPGE